MPLKTYDKLKKTTIGVNIPISPELDAKIQDLMIKTQCPSKAQQVLDILEDYFGEFGEERGTTENER